MACAWEPPRGESRRPKPRAEASLAATSAPSEAIAAWRRDDLGNRSISLRLVWGGFSHSVSRARDARSSEREDFCAAGPRALAIELIEVSSLTTASASATSVASPTRDSRLEAPAFHRNHGQYARARGF